MSAAEVRTSIEATQIIRLLGTTVELVSERGAVRALLGADPATTGEGSDDALRELSALVAALPDPWA
jgi:hypothetical protein